MQTTSMEYVVDLLHTHQSNDSHDSPPFSRFRKSFPASAENQGSTYIKIVSPTVCIQALIEAWNWR